MPSLLLAAIALADEPGPPGGTPPPVPPEHPVGFLLQVVDEAQRLEGSPRIDLVDSDGDEFAVYVVDDGEDMDLEAGDGKWSAMVSEWDGTTLAVSIDLETERWTGEMELDRNRDKPMVRVQFEDNGRLILNGGPADTVAGGPGAEAKTLDRERLPRGWWLWLALFGVAGAVLGGLAFKASRRPVARPSRLDGPSSKPIPPTRLDEAGVEAALEGPLAAFRVVALGPLPPGAAVHQCAEAGPLPQELVLAVEQLAARSGPPPALLITALERLDVMGPESASERLDALVDRRFPLWVVGGPTTWQSWPDQGEG